MCGIFGCILNKEKTEENKINISKLILTALNLLKNRGYDSCGIYLKSNQLTNIEYMCKFGVDGEEIKKLANIKNPDIFELLELNINKLNESNNNLLYDLGIGHTRWATHGGKTDYNSHPHKSNDTTITLVHNGIISNCEELKKELLLNYNFYSNTDTEVIANLIQYYREETKSENLETVLKIVSEKMVGTWACIIHDSLNPSKLYFIKNESPLLIGLNNDIAIFTSEPSGFMNMVELYYLLREKTYGWVDNKNQIKIFGEYKQLNLIKSTDNDIILSPEYPNWMLKEINDQRNLSVLVNPLTNKLRFNQENVLFNFEFIAPTKYLYIIACGSSYYAGLIASNYFRYTKAFEFVNVIDGGEFSKVHLEAISNPEKDLLVLLISQSGETRDLNIATTICREYSSNRKNKLEPNKLLVNSNSIENIVELSHQEENKIEEQNEKDEIKIIGIINVIGSLISRRTIDNVYTNCGRENAVASTKSCTSQILACLLLSIYKANLNKTLPTKLKEKFLTDLSKLEYNISELIDSLSEKTNQLSKIILEKNKSSMFLLGKDELHGCALEGALKIKEIAYIHAEGFNIAALKHGPYAMIEQDTPIIVLYKNRDHFVKSIIQEIKTRGAFVIEISPDTEEQINLPQIIKLPQNNTFTGLLAVIALQLLAYHLSINKGINPDRPRNLAKVVTVD